MRMFKFLAAMIVVLASGVVGVTAATAAPAPWVFLPGSKGETFKGELDEGSGKPKLQEQKEGKGGAPAILCKTLAILSEGSELTGPKEKDSETALAIGHFAGCEAGGAQNSKGDAAGIVLVHFELQTCLIEFAGKTKQNGVLVLPLEVVIEMFKKPFTVILDTANSGFVAPITKIGVSQYLINANQKEGLQEVRKCEGGEEESLKTLLAGATKEEKAGLEMQLLLKFSKTNDAEEVLA